jgi:Restriction endonuclease
MTKKALPSRTTNPLPFLDLDPHRFEDLVRNLIYDFKRWKSIEATGRAGNDSGFDVRAWEETSDISNEGSEDDETGSHPMGGNLWKIQCKREKEVGPTKVKAIVKEGVDKNDPPYGYILVAPATFSKQSYDAFRSELRAKGVMEFFLWGKSELEDMLFLPKNDGILFAFFGYSLSTKRRTRASEVKFSINNKNKLLRILTDGDPTRECRRPILTRDSKDTHYPRKSAYSDFDRLPRWKEYDAIAFYPTGLIFEVAEHYAFIDAKAKQWDCVDTVNLVRLRSDAPEEQQEKKFLLEQRVRSFWRFLPRANQARIQVRGIIHFDDMLAIDDKGDPFFSFPHIFVDFSLKTGPFHGFHTFFDIGRELTYLDDEYQRVAYFPNPLPDRPRGKIYKDRVVEFDESDVRQLWSAHFLRDIFDVSGKYAFLKQGDLIRPPRGQTTSQSDDDRFLEITHKYRISANDYIREHPEQRGTVERRIGRKLAKSDILTVLEFESAYHHDKKGEEA